VEVARATLPRGLEDYEAAVAVVALGVWRRSGEGEFPRDPRRYGYVSVTSLELQDAVSRGAGRGRRLRAALAARLDDRLGTPATAGVAKALLLADRSTLERDTRQRFIDAGIVHLLAISGLHVGMIAGGVSWLLGLAVRDRRRWPWAAVVVGSYVAMIGWPPAATRAALIFWGHAYCRWRDRPARISDLAGVAALIAIGTNPLLVTDPGFQLSFAGFVGVISGQRLGVTVVDRIGEYLDRGGKGRFFLPQWGRNLATALIASAGAFALTAPIAAVHFGRVVATSIPASVASTGVVGLAIPAVAATALLPGAAGHLAGEAASVLLESLIYLARVFSGVPLAWGVRPSAGWAWAVCLVLVLGVYASRRSVRYRYVLAMAALLSGSIGRPAIRRAAGLGTPLVCTLDVGQGDAAVVRTGAGRWLVFDAGPGTSVLDGRDLTGADLGFGSWMGDAGRDVIAPFLRSLGVRDIEVFALSHPHLDHFGGAGALFDRFRVRTVLDPGVAQASAAYLAFLERVEEERSMWVRAVAGDVIRIDDAILYILWPPARGGDDANETSLSFRLELPGFAYVNTGDAPIETERAILEAVAPGELRADLVKLGHHGSRTSSAVAWMEAIRPDLAVMSLGRDNRYGHPHAATLARLDSAGVSRVWRTDLQGSLCIEVAGGAWRIVHPPRG
jgi:competence protein ComEC